MHRISHRCHDRGMLLDITASHEKIWIELWIENPFKIMSKARERLSAVAVKTAKVPGFYHDGGGLYLQVSRSGTKSWVLRFTLNKKTRDMGLGPVNDWSLAEARQRARQYRQMVDEKIDPIDFRVREQNARAEAAANRKTFQECAAACHQDRLRKWKSAKHKDQWISSLTHYAFPIIGLMDIAEVGKKAVADVLRPIWLEKPETARRVLQRTRAVLTYASAHDFYPGYDLKMWDELPQLLPHRPDKKPEHHASCPYLEAANLLLRLKASSISEMLKLAFEFTVLTAARSGEARGALKSEINLGNKMWTIPDDRMKMDKAHSVPLSDRAMEILKYAISLSPGSKLLFPSPSSGKAFSDQAFTKVVLNETLACKYTAHGFRSTFRTWAAERTKYPREVCEAALAHNIMDPVEVAYARTDFVEKRRGLMQDWARFLEGPLQPSAASAVSV